MSSIHDRIRIPLCKEGAPYIGLSAFFTLVFSIFHWVVLTLIFLGITTLMVNFFRDPERIIPAEPSVIVSPADGRIVAIEKATEENFLKRERTKISIFMTILDVHVNRAPVSGQVNQTKHNPGKFWSAHKSMSSIENEKNAVLLDMDDGTQIVVVQVAGLIARRIVCWVQPGDCIPRGERFGMIRFGSRLDVFVPLNCELKVKRGQKVRAGESVLCKLT